MAKSQSIKRQKPTLQLDECGQRQCWAPGCNVWYAPKTGGARYCAQHSPTRKQPTKIIVIGHPNIIFGIQGDTSC